MPAAVERVTAPSGPAVESTTTPAIPVSEGSVGGVRTLSEGSVGGVRTSSGGSVGLSEGSVGGVRTLSGVVTEQTLGRAPARRGRVVGVSGALKNGLLVVVVADVLDQGGTQTLNGRGTGRV